MKSAVLGTIGLVCFFVIVCCGVANLEDATAKRSCTKYAQATEQTVKYVRWDRCYVQTPAGWRSLKQLRASDD